MTSNISVHSISEVKATADCDVKLYFLKSQYLKFAARCKKTFNLLVSFHEHFMMQLEAHLILEN